MIKLVMGGNMAAAVSDVAGQGRILTLQDNETGIQVEIHLGLEAAHSLATALKGVAVPSGNDALALVKSPRGH